MDGGSSDSSLRQQFARGLALKQQLSELAPSSDGYATRLESASALFHECRQLADALALFSRNEAEEDIATGDLGYLAIDFHRADLASRSTLGMDPKVRQTALQSAQDRYRLFLERLEDYEMLGGDEAKMLERWREDRDAFEVLAGDAAARRGRKIARYQQEKALKQRVEQLNQPVPSGRTDEHNRAQALAQLSLQVHQTFDALDLVASERKLLSQADQFVPPSITLSGNDARARTRDEDASSDRLDQPGWLGGGAMSGPLLDRKGKPRQPFVLTTDTQRQQVRDGVFRSSHRLPTMSIEEYLEAERARGGIIDGGGDQPTMVVDEDDIEAADRETDKQRAWDEFKEANPKGGGNTLNRG